MNPQIKKVNATPRAGVTVTRVRKVGTDGQTVQCELRQEFVNQVTNQSGLLNMTMAGHSAFSSPNRTRVAWQNFSAKQFATLGLPTTLEAINAAPTEGIKLVVPVPLNLIINGKIAECKLVEDNTLVARTWKKADGGDGIQQPKKAGQDGDVLTFDGSPIYRNITLAAKGEGLDMSFEDSIIEHNNQVVGSALKARALAASAGGVGSPSLATAAPKTGAPAIVK